MKLSLVTLFAIACSPTVEKGVEADLGYKAQQGACIERYQTREAIDACRDQVKARWATDAGAEGGAR